jgi:hypothetical protein
MPRQGGNGENERSRFGLPVHPSIPFRILISAGTIATISRTNKCLAQSNKSDTRAKATKQQSTKSRHAGKATSQVRRCY